MPAPSRRLFFRQLRAGCLWFAAGAGFMAPLLARAAAWSHDLFSDKKLPNALNRIGASDARASADLVVKGPTIAEDGAVVPIEAISRIPHTERLVFLADKNPYPLVASFRFFGNAQPEMSLRIKLAETTAVRVVAFAEGHAFMSSTDVKVTAGGCGG